MYIFIIHVYIFYEYNIMCVCVYLDFSVCFNHRTTCERRGGDAGDRNKVSHGVAHDPYRIANYT